jgi:hypothetical protein
MTLLAKHKDLGSQRAVVTALEVDDIDTAAVPRGPLPKARVTPVAVVVELLLVYLRVTLQVFVAYNVFKSSSMVTLVGLALPRMTCSAPGVMTGEWRQVVFSSGEATA